MVNSVDIAAVEMIKPSSPTPPHLKKFSLSFLDQLAPPIYVHMILYYEACHDSQEYSLGHVEMSQKLKESLSYALAKYYLLAGRIHGHSWVDCNDAGAEYSEVYFSDVRLVDVLKVSRIEDLERYVPDMPRGGPEVPLAVQVNFLDCGGVAVGVCMSHKVADAASMVTFINAWASNCRSHEKTLSLTEPILEAASRFPLADFSWFMSQLPPPPLPPPLDTEVPQKILSKRYTFDDKILAALRKAASGPGMANPTRVEALSAFIWKHYIEAATSRDKNKMKNTTFAATHAVDIRSRASPPLPCQSFGNACARAMAMIKAPDEQKYTCHELAVKLRNTIRKVDNDYIERLENCDSFLKYYSKNEENDPCFKDGTAKIEICGFTSWCQLPVYNADYGWGKPVWVSIIGVPQKNLIFLLGTKSRDGIEAWVNMAEEDIAVIDTNYQLLCSNAH